jgi:hypothetical protein
VGAATSERSGPASGAWVPAGTKTGAGDGDGMGLGVAACVGEAAPVAQPAAAYVRTATASAVRRGRANVKFNFLVPVGCPSSALPPPGILARVRHYSSYSNPSLSWTRYSLISPSSTWAVDCTTST